MKKTLVVKGLKVGVSGKEILRGVELEVEVGEVQVVMGPNGSGKSTLANTLAGHPRYEVMGGGVRFLGKDLLAMSVDERARAGFFLAFQYPVEVPGVNVFNFLHTAYNQVQGKVSFAEFRRIWEKEEKRLGLYDSSVGGGDKAGLKDRSLNEGFSGGEKKRFEVLSMAILRPKLAILDETDSGLDIDALKVVAEGVNTVREENPEMAVLLITHYRRVLKYIEPDRVQVMVNGKIVESGGGELVEQLEKEGYKNYI